MVPGLTAQVANHYGLDFLDLFGRVLAGSAATQFAKFVLLKCSMQRR